MIRQTVECETVADRLAFNVDDRLGIGLLPTPIVGKAQHMVSTTQMQALKAIRNALSEVSAVVAAANKKEDVMIVMNIGNARHRDDSQVRLGQQHMASPSILIGMRPFHAIISECLVVHCL